jgi:hypothetical protein
MSTAKLKQPIEAIAISQRETVAEEWFEMKTPPGFVPKIYLATQS